jgi:ATP-dependent Clp protease protease subunit
MIHQPHGGARGQVTDIEIQAKEARHSKEVITEILAGATGKSKDIIHKDIDRDFYMSGIQAKEYGLIDDVLPPRKKGEEGKSSRER